MRRSDGAQQRDRTDGAGLHQNPFRMWANDACADEKRASREKAALFGFAAVCPFNVRCGKKTCLERRTLKDSCCAENGAAREGCTVFHVSSSFQWLFTHFSIAPIRCFSAGTLRIPAAAKKISVVCLTPLRNSLYAYSIFLPLCGFIKAEQAFACSYCYAVVKSDGSCQRLI